MKMLSTFYLPLRVSLLFLMLLGSSSSLFSANSHLHSVDHQVDEQELLSTSLVEYVDNLYDSILPYPKTSFFVKAYLNKAGGFEAQSGIHTTTSLDYIKRSRNIFPGIGVKEIIFPFHIFL